MQGIQMSKKKQKKQKEQNRQNQQVTQTKVQHFKTRKEFITWLIGVFIWYAMCIGMIVWAIYDKKHGDGTLYGSLLLSGVIFTLAVTGIIIGTIASELGTILLGLMLVLTCLVLPKCYSIVSIVV